MSGIEPGWYKDPADPTTQRYWDGGGWLGAAIPADAPTPDGPPPTAAVDPPPGGSPGAPAPPAAPGPGSTPPAGAHPPRTGPPAPQAGPPTPQAGPPAPQAGPPGAPWAPPGPVSGGPTPHPGGPAVPPGWPQPPPGWVPVARPHGYHLAPYGARLVARIIDALALFALSAVVNAWFVWQWAREIAPVFRSLEENPFGNPPQATPRAQYLLYTILIITTALWAAYEVPALGNTGQTPGKRIMQIKVLPVEADGRLGYGRAFRRWGRLGLWTPLWSCCIGFVFQLVDSLSPLFDRRLRQAFHDRSARTVVVQLPAGTPAAGAPGAGAPDRDNPTGGSR